MADDKTVLEQMLRDHTPLANSLLCPCHGKSCVDCCPCKKFGSCKDCIEFFIEHPKKREIAAEDVLRALIDDMTMLDGAGVDAKGQPLIKLENAIKAIDTRIKEIGGIS